MPELGLVEELLETPLIETARKHDGAMGIGLDGLADSAAGRNEDNAVPTLADVDIEQRHGKGRQRAEASAHVDLADDQADPVSG